MTTVQDKCRAGAYYSKLDRSADRAAYRQDAARLELEFQNDLFSQHQVQAHPKRYLLYAKAWELGHSNGFNEVAMYFDDLVELIK